MLEELFGGVGETLGIAEGVSLGVGGVAIVVAALVAIPLAKPLTKGAIRGYLAASRRIQELAAEASESVQDVYAEAKHEYESGRAARVAVPSGSGTRPA